MHFIYKIIAFMFLSESMKCMPQNSSDIIGLNQPRRTVMLRRPIKSGNRTLSNVSSATRDENGKLQVMNRDVQNIAPITTINRAAGAHQETPVQSVEDNYPYDRLAQLDLSAYASFFDKEEAVPSQDDEESSRNNSPAESTFADRVALRIDPAPSQMEERLCTFHELKKQPRMGNNKDGINVTIINHKNATQTFSYELCGDARESANDNVQNPNEIRQVCNYHDSFPNNIKRTECRQQFAYRRLLALDAKQQVVVDDFKFPSHCECFLIKN